MTSDPLRDAVERVTEEAPDLSQEIEQALMSYLFGACQPNRGDVFGFVDDRKAEIAEFISSRLTRLRPLEADRARLLAENAEALRTVEMLAWLSEKVSSCIDPSGAFDVRGLRDDLVEERKARQAAEAALTARDAEIERLSAPRPPEPEYLTYLRILCSREGWDECNVEGSRADARTLIAYIDAISPPQSAKPSGVASDPA